MDGQAQLNVRSEAAEKKSHTKRGANFGLIAIFSGVEALFHCISAFVSMLIHTCGKKNNILFIVVLQLMLRLLPRCKNLRKGNDTSW